MLALRTLPSSSTNQRDTSYHLSLLFHGPRMVGLALLLHMHWCTCTGPWLLADWHLVPDGRRSLPSEPDEPRASFVVVVVVPMCCFNFTQVTEIVLLMCVFTVTFRCFYMYSRQTCRFLVRWSVSRDDDYEREAVC